MDIVTSLKAVCLFSRLNKKASGRYHTLDMVYSRWKWKLQYDFYFACAIYNQPHNIRDKFLNHDAKYALRFNPGVTLTSDRDKFEVYEKILPYLHRRVLSTENLSYDKFAEFVKETGSFFYKPVMGDGGSGIKKYIAPRMGG